MHMANYSDKQVLIKGGKDTLEKGPLVSPLLSLADSREPRPQRNGSHAHSHEVGTD